MESFPSSVHELTISPVVTGIWTDFFNALNDLDEAINRLVGSVDRFVANHDCVDVAVVPGDIDGGANLTLIALLGGGNIVPVGVLVLGKPDSERDLKPKFSRNVGNDFEAAGGRISPHRAGVGRNRAQIFTDLFDRRPVAQVVRVRDPLKRGVRQAGERLVDFGGDLLALQKKPKRRRAGTLQARLRLRRSASDSLPCGAELHSVRTCPLGPTKHRGRSM
jgi:hypothetical protein